MQAGGVYRELGYRHSLCEAHEACVAQILNSSVVATPVWCPVRLTADGWPTATQHVAWRELRGRCFQVAAAIAARFPPGDWGRDL
jgi:hypothetical protein